MKGELLHKHIKAGFLSLGTIHILIILGGGVGDGACSRSILGLYPQLDKSILSAAVTTKNASGHCQMYRGDQSYPS